MRPTDRLVLNDRPTQEVTGHRTGCRLQHRAGRGPGERRGRRLRNTWSVKTVPLLTPWTPPCPGQTRCPTIRGPARADVGSSTQMAEPQRTVEYAETDGLSPPRFDIDLAGQILVPYPAESAALSGVQKHCDYMLYRRTVDVPQLHQRRPAPATQLRSGQLRRHRLYERRGARAPHRRYNAFSVDITSALRSKRRKRSWWRCTLRRTAPPSRLATGASGGPQRLAHHRRQGQLPRRDRADRHATEGRDVDHRLDPVQRRLGPVERAGGTDVCVAR